MRSPTRYILLIALLTLTAVDTLTAQDTKLSKRYTKERPVTVICDWDKPPYEYLNNSGIPAGSNIDIMSTILKELNLPHRFVMKEWGNAIKTFERKKADLILANVRRFQEKPYVTSQNIINYNRIKVAVRTEDSTNTVTQRMLEESHAVFKPNDYAAKFFIDEDSIRASKIEFQSPKVALTGLVAGDNKYFVWGEAALKWKIKELNLEDITLCDVSIPISEIHVIGYDRELLDEIDDHYSRLKQSGEVERINNRWFHPEREESHTPPYTIYITVASVLLVVLFYIFHRLSRQRVRKETADASDLNSMMFKALHMGNYIVIVYDIKNDLFSNLYGSLLPDGGMTLDQFIERIHPDEQQDFRRKVERLVNGREKKSELEKHWRTSDGDWQVLHGHAMVESDADGQPAYLINAVHNETLDVREDKQYHDLMHKYDCLLNQPVLAMAIYDKDGWPLVINEPMKQICGYDNSDNERYWNSLCMFDIPLFRNAYSKNDRNDLIVCQHMEYPEMGINRYLEFHVHPVINASGEVTNYVSSAIDITDEHDRVHQIYVQERRIRQANEQINQYEKQLHYLLANSKMYVWRSNERTRMLEFSRSLRKTEFTQTYDQFLSRMDEEQQKKTLDYWRDTSAPNAVQHMVQHFALHGDGEPEWCLCVGVPIKDADGSITGHFGLLRDITDLMVAQQLLREETARAEDSGRQKSMFLASMTHEIRTPLNSIVGFSDLLRTVDAPEERHEFIRIIRTNCDMLLRLINDILEASSINDGPQSIEPVDVDFAKAFNDIFHTLEQRVQAPNVEFIEDNPCDSLPTHLDIGRIQQVITNFVINATKYTTAGHIKIGYKRKTGKGENNEDVNGLYVYCEDTGSGIPKDKQAYIFERFVKLNEFVQGTGLGLSICKSIAERCGGHIGVDSEGEGQGSTFWIWIPCPQPTTNAKSQDSYATK